MKIAYVLEEKMTRLQGNTVQGCQHCGSIAIKGGGPPFGGDSAIWLFGVWNRTTFATKPCQCGVLCSPRSGLCYNGGP